MSGQSCLAPVPFDPAGATPDTMVFLGDDLLPWLTLAIGGALAVGTALALIRPPAQQAEGSLNKAPLVRSLVQIVIGLIASIWAIASLLS